MKNTSSARSKENPSLIRYAIYIANIKALFYPVSYINTLVSLNSSLMNLDASRNVF